MLPRPAKLRALDAADSTEPADDSPPAEDNRHCRTCGAPLPDRASRSRAICRLCNAQTWFGYLADATARRRRATQRRAA
ncbi:MAG: hypothetical protein AVDCRST_MAG77-5383 [uncultured Chloroflexi bacterium]|uniref:Uncharacterized protein n=1 Tax=uncultured Chloroflexota bacterium TaxID=166587 RepID=A0A6J4K8G7_9CHLR|nr:MAG: hypothetical protein AVDCRST_MAG77-5383 [uncultured Chloroflexota bacterium]